MDSEDCYRELQKCRALIRPADTEDWHGRGGYQSFSLDELSQALGSETRTILDSYGVSFAFPEGTLRVQDVAWSSLATDWAEDAQEIAQEAEDAQEIAQEDAEAAEPDAEEVRASEGPQGAQDDEAVAQASPMEVVKDESGKTGRGPGSTWADQEVSQAVHVVSLDEDELASAEENAGRGRGEGSRRGRTSSQSQESDEDSALPRAFLQGLATEGALRRVLARACN